MTTSPEPHVDHAAASALVGELYEAHGRMVVGLCRFLLRDAIEAEDAAQQVFVAVHRSLLGGSRPRDAPAWLATIARNECRFRIKRRMREPLAVAEPDAEPGTGGDPFVATASRDDLRKVREELVRLPRPQRDAFVLREFAGLSYDEVAVALGVTEPAVESLLVRARSRLRLVLMRANLLFVPVAVRDQLARFALGADDGTTGAAAKLASLPFAAKIAAAGAGVALVAGGGAALDHQAPPKPEASARAVVEAVAPRVEARAQAPLEGRPPVAAARHVADSHAGSVLHHVRRVGTRQATTGRVRHDSDVSEHHGRTGASGSSGRSDDRASVPVTPPPSEDPAPVDTTAPAGGDPEGPGPAVGVEPSGSSGPGGGESSSGGGDPGSGGSGSSGPGSGGEALVLAETSSGSSGGSGESGSGGGSSGHGSDGGSGSSHDG